MKNTKPIFFVKMAFFGLLAVTAFTFITMALWNWLIVDLFSGPQLSFWQALGLLILSKILFSGFHKHGHSDYNHAKMRDHFKSKFHNLSAEEKEHLKSRLEEKWFKSQNSDNSGNNHGC